MTEPLSHPELPLFAEALPLAHLDLPLSAETLPHLCRRSDE
jgi:hypothetical protein